MDRLREHLRNHLSQAISTHPSDTVLRFPAEQPSKTQHGATVLELVSQAAEMVRRLENHSAETEARARDLTERAVEQLRAAEDELHSVEAERQANETRLKEIIAKFQMTQDTLEKMRARNEHLEARLSDAEKRAQASDMRANEAKESLQRIEDAIRSQLLGQRAGAHPYANRVA